MRVYVSQRTILWIGIVLCFLYTVMPLMAQQRPDTTKTYSISEVRVTEQRRNAATRSSAPLQILSSAQIKQLNVLQVADAVKFFSGVVVKDYGGIGGLKTVSVRSLGANHTAVTYDGIALTDVQTGQLDLGRFSLDNVDMLSLSNGQADNIFQPARQFASASVINIKTLSPSFAGKETFRGKVSLKGGSFGLINPSVWMEKKISTKLSATISTEWLSADGKYPYRLNYGTSVSDSTSREIRQNTDVKNIRVEATVYGHFSKTESAYLKSYFYHSQRGLPGATIYYNTANFSSQRIKDYTLFIQGNYQKDISRKFCLQANAKFNEGYLRYLDPTYQSTSGRLESIYRQKEYYASAAVLYKTTENISFSASSDGVINTMTADFDTSSEADVFSKPTRCTWLNAMAAKYINNKVLATTSLVSTLVTEKVKIGDAANDQRKLSPYISLAVKPFDNSDFRIRAFYKNIFRLPTFNDLYYNKIGNSNLKPETTNQLNIGLTYSTKFCEWMPLFSVTVDAYSNKVSDKIVALPTKNIFVWTMVNLGKVDITGLDLTTETRFKIGSETTISAGASYTYQRALDITDPSSRTYKHQLPYTPRTSGSGKLAIETSLGALAYSVLFSGSRYAGFQNYAEYRLSGYSDHSISYSHHFQIKKKTVHTSIEVLNLLDENYAIVRFFPMPGRSVRITGTFQF